MSYLENTNNDDGDLQLNPQNSLQQIMRLLGALGVVLAMSLFLLEGWSAGNDLQRYLLLLCQTGVLGGTAIAMGYGLRDGSSARLLFGLALLSITANFTVLGALFYSFSQWDGALMQYPDSVTWITTEPMLYWPVLGASILGLGILSRFCFAIFARPVAWPMSLSFIALNCFLLFPVRSSLSVAILITISGLAAIYILNHIHRSDESAMTWENRFAKASLFAPTIIILARALSLYEVDTVLTITVSGLAYIGLRNSITKFEPSSKKRVLATVFMFLTGLVLSGSIIELTPISSENFAYLIWLLSILLLVIDQIKISTSAGLLAVLINGSLGLLLLIGTIILFETNSVPLLSGILVGFGLWFHLSWHLRNHDCRTTAAMVMAACGAGATLLALFNSVISLQIISQWAVIGLVGLVLIITAGLMDKFHSKRSMELNKETH
ncbi:MAG: hypothetical protein AAF197_07315 [Pseudomonadota bacterium]